MVMPVKGRVYVTKLSTGAVWSSCNPASGVWRKEWMGAEFTRDSIPAGGCAMNFFPGSRKNRRRFVPGIVNT